MKRERWYILNSEEFVQLVGSIVSKDNRSPFVVAQVSATHPTTGQSRPSLKFAGMVNADNSKTYPYLSSYTARPDDKVLCLNIGGTYLVIGKINT